MFCIFWIGLSVALLSIAAFKRKTSAGEGYLMCCLGCYLLVSENKLALPFSIAYRIFKILVFSFF
jgi:hypothetical protein